MYGDEKTDAGEGVNPHRLGYFMNTQDSREFEQTIPLFVILHEMCAV